VLRRAASVIPEHVDQARVRILRSEWRGRLGRWWPSCAQCAKHHPPARPLAYKE